MNRPASLLCLSAVLIAPLTIAPSVRANAASVNAAFGNTIVSTYPDGRIGKLWLKPGGDYSAEGRRHDKSSGHWKVSGDKLCLKQSRPIPMFIKFCTPIPAGGMDHAWAAKAVTGEPIRVQLVRGQA